MIVVATNDVEADEVLLALVPQRVQVSAPGGARRLVLASIDDDGKAERLVSTLRWAAWP